jgi:hypothetical protein
VLSGLGGDVWRWPAAANVRTIRLDHRMIAVIATSVGNRFWLGTSNSIQANAARVAVNPGIRPA